jgi:sister-chromatid-cohesion protein PDS5
MKGEFPCKKKRGANGRCHTRVHMRYRATTCFLKLAKVKDFDKAISPYFETIATMTLDPSETVRHRLLIKLSEVLPTQRLLPRWNIIPAMSASDPEPENIALVSQLNGVEMDGGGRADE